MPKSTTGCFSHSQSCWRCAALEWLGADALVQFGSGYRSSLLIGAGVYPAPIANVFRTYRALLKCRLRPRFVESGA